MLAAGVLGTAMGDWLADAGPGRLLGLTDRHAVLPVGAVWAAYRFGLSKGWYWIAIATCRTWGTDLGDMLVVMFRLVASRPVALWIAHSDLGSIAYSRHLFLDTPGGCIRDRGIPGAVRQASLKVVLI